jgi:hypothetical protein
MYSGGYVSRRQLSSSGVSALDSSGLKLNRASPPKALNAGDASSGDRNQYFQTICCRHARQLVIVSYCVELPRDQHVCCVGLGALVKLARPFGDQNFARSGS